MACPTTDRRAETFRRVVAMVDKILKETRPADIPVEQPTKFELAINLRTTKDAWLDDSVDDTDAGEEKVIK